MNYDTPGLSRPMGDGTTGVLVVREDLTESHLKQLYYFFKLDGSLGHIYPEGEPTLDWFLGWFSRPENRMLGCFIADTATDRFELVGAGFINSMVRTGEFSKAEVGAGFFQHFNARSLRVAFGRLMVQYCFERLGLSSVFGVTPVWNFAAISWARLVGFGQVNIPDYTSWEGKPCAAVMSWFTRSQWEVQHGRAA